MRVLLHHHLVVLLFFLATYIQLATCEFVTETKVEAWSQELSQKFANFLDVTMGMPKLQQMYDDVPTTTTTKEGRVLAASAAAEIASLLSDKDSELRLLAKKCSEKSTTKEMIQSTQISMVKKLQDQGDDQIMRAYFTSHDDGTMVLHSVPGHTDADEVAPTASTAGYTPIHPPSGDKESDPAFPFVSTTIYDARRTSWYSNAVAGPKDVFVVVDETNIGSDASRWDALKSTLQHVLNTISPNDNVWIHRRTGTKTTEKKTIEESIAEAAPPLLTPLGGKSCLGGHVRGKASVVQQLSDVVQKMQISTTLASAPASDADDWLNMLNTTMHVVDYVRRSLHVRNAERAGVILLLSTGGLESQSVQDAIVPFVLDRNLHHLPIVAYHIAEKVAAAPSAEKLAYSCTDLGSSAWMTSSSHPAEAGLYFEHIVEAPSTDSSSQRDPLTSRLSSNLILWGGLFAHAPKIGDFGGVGGSNTPNIMTLTRSVYRYDDSDKSARPTLLGVVAFDLHLRTLKDILDAVSENLGRTSFPLLVTPFGDTIYHVLMTKFKKRDLFHVGVDVSNYEYFQDISTPKSERSFDNTVRPAFLSGELGNKRIRVLRALPAGDAATEGFEGREIDTTYFYRGVTGWDLRLALVVDQFDLQQTMMHPRGGGSSNSSRVITSQLKDYVGNDNIKNMELAELVPNIKFINNDNCPDSTSGAAFGNCQPDEYCARVLRGEEHPIGVIPGRPVCVDTSTCECEIHRWPVGLTAKRVACMHVAPKSLIVPQNAYDLQNSNADKSDLTYDMTKFLNLDRNSINPSRQRLRPDSIEHALTSAPIIQEWVADQVKGVHNDTVWLYYGSMTGMSIIFPPNNWGFLWDPTRRPWYGRAISSGLTKRSAISTPYVDGGGAGLMNTLASVVWGPSLGIDSDERSINGVAGFDFLYPVMDNFLPSLTDCSPKKVRDIGQDADREIMCFLFEMSGLFLSHTDFLASDEEKEKVQQAEGTGTDDTAAGAWPVENVFVGKKEPDLADVLIEAGVIQNHSSRTPDSAKTVNFYRVNEEAFIVTKSDGTKTTKKVLSGILKMGESSKCLRAPIDNGDVKWFVSPVQDSNAFMLVVDGYRRKDTECTVKTQSNPPTNRENEDIINSCGIQQKFSFEAESWQKILGKCPFCDAGEFGANAFQSCQPCPPGTFSKYAGSASCTNCTAGTYNEVQGQSTCRICDKGKYSLEIGAFKNPCQPCPRGAVCSGGVNMETSVMLSIPQPGSTDGKNVYLSYWRDPEILNKTSKASTCFYQCVEPKACLGTLSCNDEENGVGTFCQKNRDIIMKFSKSINGSNDPAVLSNYTMIKSEKTTCIETSSLGDQYCIVARLDEQCSRGYTGPACAGCVPGYSRDGVECAECMDISAAIAMVTVGLIGGLALYAFLIISTLKDFGALTREGIIARVIASNILIVSMFKDLEVKWPWFLKAGMGAGSVAGDPVALLNLECLISSDGPNQIPFVILKSLVSLMVPIVMALILGVIFGIKEILGRISWRKKLKKLKEKNSDSTFQGDVFSATLEVAMAKRFKKGLEASQQRKKDGTTKDINEEEFGGEGLLGFGSVIESRTMFQGSMVVMAYMLYPSLLKNTFAMIECVQMKSVGNEKECSIEMLNVDRYYFKDQSVRCFDNRHNFWLAALFAPALIFYVLCIPIIFILKIRKHKTFVFAGPTLQRVIWGFVTSGYEIDEYYWEMVVLARKAVIVFIMVFVRPAGPMMTALCCIMTLLFALVAHSQWMPFVDYHIDLLEKASLVTNIIMILLGLMFNYTSDSQAVAVTILIVATNLGFFGIAFRMKIGSAIAEAKRKKAREKNIHKVAPSTTSSTSASNDQLHLDEKNYPETVEKKSQKNDDDDEKPHRTTTSTSGFNDEKEPEDKDDQGDELRSWGVQDGK